MSLQYIVEMSTLHGPSRQRRWHRVHTDVSRSACQGWVDQAVSGLSTDAEAPRSWGLTRERALQGYRIRGVRS